MTGQEPLITDFKRIKLRIEQLGLILSLAGLISILQPINLSLYTNGFFILILGALIYFLGSTMPDEAKKSRALMQITILFTVLILIILLSIYTAPILIQ
ncbi:MAG: hypothetical protein QF381_00590 [Nitrososphaerales archaeon]|jgi:drug/metabolite transporter (DMT)-like permease|nr:hypothetical protein [Nitrososphaerales archaeon]|tara:strand:+ start:3152 stop:3448 length:297 start_codon:yes stop_codon:yes gene_type:complete